MGEGKVEVRKADLDWLRDVGELHGWEITRRVADAVEALQAKLEAAERDAALIEFLNSTSFEVHVRNGRRYSAGCGSARTVLEMARSYQAAALSHEKEEGK